MYNQFTELHTVIDASVGSDSLNEHLASIVKLDVANNQDVLKQIPAETIDVTGSPNESLDLKSDASGYYGYGAYRQPYYNYNYNPYYTNYNWQDRNYGNYYNSQPYYNPYVYRRYSYYPGYYNPYRRQYPGQYYY